MHEMPRLAERDDQEGRRRRRMHVSRSRDGNQELVVQKPLYHDQAYVVFPASRNKTMGYKGCVRARACVCVCVNSSLALLGLLCSFASELLSQILCFLVASLLCIFLLLVLQPNLCALKQGDTKEEHEDDRVGCRDDAQS